MKVLRTVAAVLFVVFLFPVSASTQSYGQDIEQSNRRFRETMAAMSDFVKDVTFGEKDVKSVIANWREFSALGDELGGDRMVEGHEEEEIVDFEKLLAYPAYRAWSKSKGLNPDTWMKKFMRIQVMMMKEAVGEGVSEGEVQIRQQLAELEAQRAQLGEEMYRQMKAAMEAGATTMRSVETSYAGLPDPTPGERKLLERYRDQLMNLK